MNNNVKTILKKSNLNFKKELAILISLNVLLIALMITIYFLTNSAIYFIPFIFIIFVANGFYFYRYYYLYQKNEKKMLKELIDLFKYFYLDINNRVAVNDAIFSLKEKASLKMNEYLDKFIEDVDNDKSLTPYLTFAHNFNSVLVEEMMVNLYQFKSKKTITCRRGFNNAYLKLKEIVEENNRNENKKNFVFSKTTAVIGAAIIVIIVIIAVIVIVRQYIHG